MWKKLKLAAAVPLAAWLIALGAEPSAAAPNENASCVAQTSQVLGPPGTGEDGGPIGGDIVSLLAHFPNDACPGVP